VSLDNSASKKTDYRLEDHGLDFSCHRVQTSAGAKANSLKMIAGVTLPRGEEVRA
jgi:hypothetical protein